MEKKSIIKTIDHMVITTADLEACLHFYEELLGMEHKIEGQTVKVSKEAKRVPPKTGDDTPLKLWLALMFAAIAAVLPLAIKETIERRKQHKEDMEMFG